MNDIPEQKFKIGEPAIIQLYGYDERIHTKYNGARVIIVRAELREENTMWCYDTIPPCPKQPYFSSEAMWREPALRKLPPDELKDTDQDTDYDIPKLLEFKQEA